MTSVYVKWNFHNQAALKTKQNLEDHIEGKKSPENKSDTTQVLSRIYITPLELFLVNPLASDL